MLITERVQVISESDEFIGAAMLTHYQVDDWRGHLVFDGPDNPSQVLSLNEKLLLVQPNKSTLAAEVDRILGNGARLRIFCSQAD